MTQVESTGDSAAEPRRSTAEMLAITFLRLLSGISLVLTGQVEPAPAPTAHAQRAGGSAFEALLYDGQAVPGTLRLDSRQNRFQSAQGRSDLSLRDIRVLRNAAARQTTRQFAPQWQFQIGGGERFSGELPSAIELHAPGAAPPQPAAAVPVLFRGEATVRLSSDHFRAVLSPANESVLSYSDCETVSLEWTTGGEAAKPQTGEHLSGSLSLVVPSSGSLTFRPAKFPRSGRIQWQLFDPERAVASSWKVSFQFAEPNKSAGNSATVPLEWQVEPKGDRYISTAIQELRLTPLPVNRKNGWRQWTLVLGEEQTLLSVDGQVLAVGPLLPRNLVAIDFSSAKPSSDAKDRTPRIDDVLVTEITPPNDLPLPRNTQRQDLIWLQGGDELFGTVTRLSSQGVVMNFRTQTKSIDVRDLAGVLGRSSAERSSPAATRGYHAWVQLTNGLWCRMREPDRLCLALQSIEEQTLSATHPLLGAIRLPLLEVDRIEPLFRGERQLVLSGPIHLGDEARADFSVPLPSGSRIERKLNLEQVPAGEAYCSMLCEDLEPSGPHTPETSPHLASLQAGHLLTELFVNDRSLGDINRYTSQLAKPGDAARLRVPIPKSLLKAGVNVLQLRQRPAANDPANFDDCQISQWAVEWEQRE